LEPEGSLPCLQESIMTSPILNRIDTVNTLHPISLRSILILSSYLHLSVPSGLFPSRFPTKILYSFLTSPIRAAHLVFLHFITPNIWWRAHIVKLRIMQFLPSFVLPPLCSVHTVSSLPCPQTSSVYVVFSGWQSKGPNVHLNQTVLHFWNIYVSLSITWQCIVIHFCVWGMPYKWRRVIQNIWVVYQCKTFSLCVKFVEVSTEVRKGKRCNSLPLHTHAPRLFLSAVAVPSFRDANFHDHTAHSH